MACCGNIHFRGIQGTDITLPRAVLYSLPIVGMVASAVKTRHFFLPCFFKPLSVADQYQSEFERQESQPLLTGDPYGTIDLSSMSGLLSQNTNRDKIYFICGIVSSIFTLALAAGFLFNYCGYIPSLSICAVPLVFLLGHAYGLYKHYQKLS